MNPYLLITGFQSDGYWPHITSHYSIQGEAFIGATEYEKQHPENSIVAIYKRVYINFPQFHFKLNELSPPLQKPPLGPPPVFQHEMGCNHQCKFCKADFSRLYAHYTHIERRNAENTTEVLNHTVDRAINHNNTLANALNTALDTLQTEANLYKMHIHETTKGSTVYSELVRRLDVITVAINKSREALSNIGIKLDAEPR